MSDDKPCHSPTSKDVGVVSFDTSQLDSSTQLYGADDAYKNSVGPLHHMDTANARTATNESQEFPHQSWNRGNPSGLYEARTNMDSYGNHHSHPHPHPSFCPENEAQGASHWRRRLNTGSNLEQPIINGVSFSSSEQHNYHGGYRPNPDSYQTCHRYHSSGPQYHSGLQGYHHQSHNSFPRQAQHHLAHSPCYQQSPYHEGTSHESNGNFLRLCTIDASGRESKQIYPSPPPYHLHQGSTPRHYLQPPPNFLARNYAIPNAEDYHRHQVDHFRPEHPPVGMYGKLSRKRKFVDTSCTQENKKEYMIYTDRCMSPMSDISVSSAASQDLDDHFVTQFQTPYNKETQEPVPFPMIAKQQNVSARSDNPLTEEVGPQNCENHASLEVPRIERGEKYQPYFNFNKSIGPVRTVTPMKGNAPIQN